MLAALACEWKIVCLLKLAKQMAEFQVQCSNLAPSKHLLFLAKSVKKIVDLHAWIWLRIVYKSITFPIQEYSTSYFYTAKYQLFVSIIGFTSSWQKLNKKKMVLIWHPLFNNLVFRDWHKLFGAPSTKNSTCFTQALLYYLSDSYYLFSFYQEELYTHWLKKHWHFVVCKYNVDLYSWIGKVMDLGEENQDIPKSSSCIQIYYVLH